MQLTKCLLKKAKILRKSGRYRGTLFLVSRSFDSQRSWKEASTQGGAKGAARKNFGRENLQKNMEPNPQKHLSIQMKVGPEMAMKWFTVLPRPCSQTELVYTVLQNDTPNRLNSKCADYSSTKQSHAQLLYLYRPLPIAMHSLYFLKQRALALQIHQDKLYATCFLEFVLKRIKRIPMRGGGNGKWGIATRPFRRCSIFTAKHITVSFYIFLMDSCKHLCWLHSPCFWMLFHNQWRYIITFFPSKTLEEWWVSISQGGTNRSMSTCPVLPMTGAVPAALTTGSCMCSQDSA